MTESPKERKEKKPDSIWARFLGLFKQEEGGVRITDTGVWYIDEKDIIESPAFQKRLKEASEEASEANDAKM